ncbi:MAG TPA: hypothetical protein VHB45_10310 [Alloacidobacterium sp.]|nr:hypothetical protein [Alloacidobacterium sp.]
MSEREEKFKQLKANVEKALEDLTQISSTHSPESPEVKAAKEKRAQAEKELVDFRGTEP